MLRKHKNPSAELSADLLEFIARIVGPLHKRTGLSRKAICDCFAEAGAPVSKARMDRWIGDYTQSGSVFTPEKVTDATPLLDAEQQ